MCLPYENEQGISKEFYPDLLIVRRDADGYVVDVLEPHDPKQRDNIGKVKGFAEYAKQNPITGRLQLIREKKVLGQEILIRLDMSKGLIRDKICRATGNPELDNIFDEYGTLR